jgi:hypothetical protein
MMEIMQMFSAYKANQKSGTINKILGEINVNRMEDVIILSIIRCVKPIKKDLQNWDVFVAKAQKSFKDSDLLNAALEKE